MTITTRVVRRGLTGMALTGLALTALCTVPLIAQQKLRIIQTNSAGDNVHLIDPATNKVVGIIEGIEVNHGAAAAPDGSRIYISDEAENALAIVDARTLRVTNRVPLSGHPNNIAISRDGRRVYVGIRDPEPGGVDVVDTASLKMVKTIPTQGAIHNPYVTPDGRFVVAGSISGATVNVIDASNGNAGVDAEDGPRNPAHDVCDQSRRIDKVDFRAVDRPERIRGGGLRDPQGDHAHRAPGASGREVDRTRRIGPLARRAGHRRRQDARCLQPVEQLPVLLFAAGPEAPGRRRTRGQGSRLGHPHA